MGDRICEEQCRSHDERTCIRQGIRAHFISQSALTTLLLGSSTVDDSLKKDAETCFVSLLDNSATLEDIEHSNALHDIDDLLSKRLAEVCSSGRTEKLLVQYFKLVTIIRLFIRAERCGDWQLHVHSVWLMIPYLHSAGHLHYARSAQVYLQEMLNLVNIMAPDEYDMFTSRGFFTVRRSDKYWCGIWTDMTIEQVLMRSLKTSGGLTCGRGISPSLYCIDSTFALQSCVYTQASLVPLPHRVPP